MKTLKKNNLILGDLLVSLAASTNLGKQEVLDLLTNSIGLQLTGMTPSGEKFHLEIGEFLSADLEMYDGDTGIQIEEVDFTV
ncbi:hypothetical protein V7200_03660 [Cytobacillus firmus]|uniref:Uncharacterized protein n=1 Tax=Cytobacillus firmus TaxID=1399 RepID=A0A800MUR5_CYTFI|nr:hypothetical protein [Cytobacillus firmus]KAF0822660.1 hypothetical protein KIS1582_3554 [Cytobacillus firmus]